MSKLPPRKLAVILHADIADSTKLVTAHEGIAHTRIQETFDQLSALVESHAGTTHEIRGDALVAEFDLVSNAVDAALKFQRVNQDISSDCQLDICP